MDNLKDIIKDDQAFENLLVRAMHKVRHEQDKKRIEDIRGLNEEEFRQVISNNSGKKIPLKRQIIRYAVAACLACMLIFTGGIQYNAYHQTINIGDKYLAQISNDVSNMKGEVSEEVTNNLKSLFQNVAEGKDLKNTIANLQKAYLLSEDSDSDYNYVRNIIAWNLAMAHLKSGDRESAKPILDKIVTDPENEGKAIQELAQQTLDDIDDIFSIW